MGRAVSRHLRVGGRRDERCHERDQEMTHPVPVIPHTLAPSGRGGATKSRAAVDRRINHAPLRQIAAPAIDTAATCSLRTQTPRTSATTGMRNVVADAVVAPMRPA